MENDLSIELHNTLLKISELNGYLDLLDSLKNGIENETLCPAKTIKKKDAKGIQNLINYLTKAKQKLILKYDEISSCIIEEADLLCDLYD